MFITILFYFFAIAIIFSAIQVVMARNPVHAVLWLVVTFAMSSIQWILMQAEFLGIVLLLVYVGAVMVLFLFVVMMLNIDIETIRAGFWKNLPLSFLIGLLMAAALILVLISPDVDLAAINQFKDLTLDYNSVKEFGVLMYTDYLIPVELAAVLLVLGMVSSIALVHRKNTNPKYVQVKDQVKVVAKGRIKMVNMEPVIEPSENNSAPESSKEAQGE